MDVECKKYLELKTVRKKCQTIYVNRSTKMARMYNIRV